MMLSHRIRQQDGYTILEVLIICAIVGVLTALSYTTFTGRDRSAMDAEAKSNARSLLTKVHTCFTATEDYTLCDEPTEQEPPPGVNWGTNPGEAEVVRGPETTRHKVTVLALSRAETDGANHRFLIVKEHGREHRTCETGGGDDAGGCKAGQW